MKASTGISTPNIKSSVQYSECLLTRPFLIHFVILTPSSTYPSFNRKEWHEFYFCEISCLFKLVYRDAHSIYLDLYLLINFDPWTRFLFADDHRHSFPWILPFNNFPFSVIDAPWNRSSTVWHHLDYLKLISMETYTHKLSINYVYSSVIDSNEPLVSTNSYTLSFLSALLQ